MRVPWPSRRSLVVAGSLAAVTLAGSGYVGWRALQAQWQAEAVARALTRGEPSRAPMLITRYGCGGCHTIPGAPGADGKVAAPLGSLRERAYVGGVARHTPENLIRWIVAPQSLSPRSAMPATGITEDEARDVAAFLYTH